MKKVIPKYSYDYEKEVPVDKLDNFKCFISVKGSKPEMFITSHWFDCISIFLMPAMEDITWQYRMETIEDYMKAFPNNTLYAFKSYKEAFKYLADNLEGIK